MKTPPLFAVAISSVATTQRGKWRRDPESNRARRICNPPRGWRDYAAALILLRFLQPTASATGPIYSGLSKKTPPLVAAFFALFLAACGGGTSQTTTPTQPQTITIYGDSTSVGVDGSTLAPGQPCPAPTAALPYGCTFAPAPGTYIHIPGYTVDIRALSGGSLLDRFNGAHGLLPWADEMATHPGRVIVIALGINDSFSTLDVPLYAATLASMVDTARAHGKLVVLQTEGPTFRATVADYMAAMRQVATDKAAPLIDVERAMAARPLPHDGLHEDAQGYMLIGQLMQARLVEILTP